MRLKAVALFILITSSQAIAGGSASPAKITSFIPNDDNIMAYEMTLRYYDDGKGWEISEFEGCDEITINGFYDYQRWQRYGKLISAKGHRQSIAYLMTAMQMDRPIYFGTFGMGLVKKSQCVYKSRGLVRWGPVYSLNGLL